MKKINTNALLQFLGALGVIGSLIFVGLEMRQSQRIAIAAQIQARSNTMVEALATYTEAGIDWAAALFGGEVALSKEEIARKNIYQAQWFLFESDFFQYSVGLMTQPVWEAKLVMIGRLVDQCDLRNVLEARLISLEKAFRDVILSREDNCE
jgi:hypothetical protein